MGENFLSEIRRTAFKNPCFFSNLIFLQLPVATAFFWGQFHIAHKGRKSKTEQSTAEPITKINSEIEPRIETPDQQPQETQTTPEKKVLTAAGSL